MGNTYRSYSSAQAGLERNIERLSSGLRINRAADDSAGLAISQRMNNQVRSIQQANNMMQTAEGGLNQIHSILGRMRELAVQSASDGLNADDRASIDLEFQQLKAEISRIGEATEYNGMKLINGERQKSTSLTGSGRNTGTGEVQTLYQPDTGGFAENDVLNFDQLGITIELGADFADAAEGTASTGVPASGEIGADYFEVTQGS